MIYLLYSAYIELLSFIGKYCAAHNFSGLPSIGSCPSILRDRSSTDAANGIWLRGRALHYIC